MESNETRVLDKAREAEQRADWKEARNCYLEAATQSTDDANLHRKVAYCSLHLYDFRTAFDHDRRAVELNPFHTWAWVGIVVAGAFLKADNEVRKAFAQVKKLTAASEANVHYMEASYYFGLRFFEQWRYAGAAEYFGQVTRAAIKSVYFERLRSRALLYGAIAQERSKDARATLPAIASPEERQYMKIAIEQARDCEPEAGRTSPPPKVGAVIVRGNSTLSYARRGGRDPREHAEYIALDTLDNGDATGATVYTTLEPCTDRNYPKHPCADRIITAGVNRVVIGMIDPNPRINGDGILTLRKAGVIVEMFPNDLQKEVETINAEFVEVQRSSAYSLHTCELG